MSYHKNIDTCMDVHCSNGCAEFYGCVRGLSKGSQSWPASLGEFTENHSFFHHPDIFSSWGSDERPHLLPQHQENKEKSVCSWRRVSQGKKWVLAEDVIALTYQVKVRVQNPAHGEGSFSCMMLCIFRVLTIMGELTPPPLCPSTVNSSAKLCLASPHQGAGPDPYLIFLLLSVWQWGC